MTRAAFLVGDSHASNHIVSVHAAFKGSYEVRFATVGHGCGFTVAGGVPNIPRCAQLHALIMQGLRDHLKAGDLLFTSAHSAWGAAFNSPASHEAFLGTIATLAKSRGAHLVLLGDTPSVRAGHTCVTSAGRYETMCDQPANRALLSSYSGARSFDEMYARVALAHAPNAHAVRLVHLFCDQAATCGASIPGTHTIGIGDDSHLTLEGSMYVAPFLACFLEGKGLL